MVLIHKFITETRGICLLDTLWKVVDVLIDTCLHASIQFHDVLHGFWVGIGMETTIMDLKLSQELVRVDHNHLFLVLLYLRKAYYTI